MTTDEMEHVTIITVSDEAKPLTFTLADHDALRDCADGIARILEKLDTLEKRQTAIELRMKVVEDWKIKVMAIVLCIGIVLGWIFSSVVPAFLPLLIPARSQSAPLVVTPVTPPTASRR